MSAHMKKHLTKNNIELKDMKGRIYLVPKNIAVQYKVDVADETQSISAAEFFLPYEQKFTKPGLLLRGLRVREGLTQTEFAEKIAVTQANLSHMENGRRPIGRDIAKRIEKQFRINYKNFLE